LYVPAQTPLNSFSFTLEYIIIALIDEEKNSDEVINLINKERNSYYFLIIKLMMY